MAKNRFKTSGPTIDFNDPSVLTVIPSAVQEEPVKEEVKEVKETPMVAEKKEAPVVVEDPINNIVSKMQKKPEGKSCSLYLDVEVIAAIDKVAKQNKISKSTMVNMLLRDLLIK